jgi:molybdopterin-guanine dinucleotide biosynthesis protein A
LFVSLSIKEVFEITFFGYDFVNDNTDLKGPINGIISVHKMYPVANLLVVHCDMMKLDDSFLLDLISSKFQVYNEDQIQPFPMYITGDKLNEISNTKLERFSIKNIIQKFNVNTKKKQFNRHFSLLKSKHNKGKRCVFTPSKPVRFRSIIMVKKKLVVVRNGMTCEKLFEGRF